MTCVAFYKRRRERPASVGPIAYRRQASQQRRVAVRPVAAQERVPMILGTWDYKWPLGTKIRVAFQLPPRTTVFSTAFEDACAEVERTGKRWFEALHSGKYQELEKHLPKLEFLQGSDRYFEPPLGPENSLTDQHRSPFRTDRPRVEYDVLVSFQDLPVTRADPFRGFGEELEEIVFPTCELGSYARRSDYGAPTAYMGRFGRYLNEDLLSYLKSDDGQHTVVHIFGHVLGLAHAYQHPTLVPGKREDFYRPVPEIVEFMSANLGVELPPEIVTENLLQAWPGDFAFSDWLDYSQSELEEHKRGKIDSVMVPPYYAHLIKNPPREEYPIVTTPSERDLDTLRLMYEPGAADQLPYSKP